MGFRQWYAKIRNMVSWEFVMILGGDEDASLRSTQERNERK